MTKLKTQLISFIFIIFSLMGHVQLLCLHEMTININFMSCDKLIEDENNKKIIMSFDIIHEEKLIDEGTLKVVDEYRYNSYTSSQSLSYESKYPVQCFQEGGLQFSEIVIDRDHQNEYRINTLNTFSQILVKEYFLYSFWRGKLTLPQKTYFSRVGGLDCESSLPRFSFSQALLAKKPSKVPSSDNLEVLLSYESTYLKYIGGNKHSSSGNSRNGVYENFSPYISKKNLREMFFSSESLSNSVQKKENDSRVSRIEATSRVSLIDNQIELHQNTESSEILNQNNKQSRFEDKGAIDNHTESIQIDNGPNLPFLRL
jgi:hypothetical protein